MNKCQCPQSGFCEFFRQEMTYSPPNWQWCQNATQKKREEYKITCDKKHDRKMRLRDESFFITCKAMVDDCVNLLIPKISTMQISGIVGIPRSGMLVSSICATLLNLPLYTLSQGEIVPCNSISEFGGDRMSGYEPSSGKSLVLDDTVFGGGTLEKIKTSLGNNYYYGALYVRPDLIEKVDIFGKELNSPHLLEWHFFKSNHTENSLFDLDGILSPNVPSECQDEESYIRYIKNVKPFYHRIPKTRCKGIATARLEKYRSITEDWLKRYGIKYGFLKMYPTEKEEVRNKNHVKEAASFKSKVFYESDAKFFVESETAEAALIRAETKKLVICPNVYPNIYPNNTKQLPPPLDLVDPISLNDTLPEKKSDLAICVIPANKQAMDQLNITRGNIIKYAKRCKADYVELKGDKSPDWPMYNKFRLRQVVENYEHTLYLDCDVVIKDDAPNIYKNFKSDKVCFVNEWDILEESYDKLLEGMLRERQNAIEEYSHLAKNNRAVQPNGGVMLFPKSLACKYSQPPNPYAKRWCFDQDYLLLNLKDDEFEIIDWRYNLEFIDSNFWNKIEDAYFIHLNGSKPIKYRLELLSRLTKGDYSFFNPPKPKDDDSTMEKFRPSWWRPC